MQQFRALGTAVIGVLRMANGVQIPSVGAGSLNINYEGYASNQVQYTWDGANTRYQTAADADLVAFLNANVGNTVGVGGAGVV